MVCLTAMQGRAVSNPKRHYRTLITEPDEVAVGFQILKGIIGRPMEMKDAAKSLVSNPKRHYRTKNHISGGRACRGFKS